MNRISAPLYAAICAIALFAGTEAQAAIVWQFDWTPGTSTVISDSGNNQINFSNQPALSASGNSDIIATSITIGTPFVGTSDTFTHQNYSLKLKLTDTASGEFATLTFTGDLTGPVTSSSADIDNVFDVAHSVAEVDLGDNHYKVTIGPYTPPGPPGSFPGSIGAHVEVRPNGGADPHDTPEPSTLLMSCLGLAGIGFRSWRKRQQANS